MNFNVNVELNYLDEDETIDEALQSKITAAIVKKMEDSFMEESAKTVTATAQKVIAAKVELLINSVLEKPVVVSTGWNSSKDYDSIFAMVEEELSSLYKEKLGKTNKCVEDQTLATLKNYIKGEVDRLIATTSKLVETRAKKEAKKAYEENEVLQMLGARLEKAQRHGHQEDTPTLD